MPSSVINDGSLETGRAPTSSPILDGLSDPSSITAEQMQQEALVRLQNLQQQIVGGEKKDDNQLKEKHKKRKDHVFSRKEKLVNALKTLDNSDQVVIKVYDSLQDEIKANNKKSKHLEDELKSAKGEIDDLQVEFEREREDYLETIRKQEMQMSLQKQLLERIQPLLRRDCNYSNLDHIMAESKWDEERARWILPELIVERTTLPAAGAIAPAARKPKSGNSPPNGYYDAGEEDRFLQHLNRTSSREIAATYFAPKRANRILEQSLLHAESNGFDSGRRRSSSPCHEATSPTESFPSNMRPVRLESLSVAPIGGKKSKKKKRADHNL